MLLIMHNLPGHIRYCDIKWHIRNKCNIDDIILDKLVKDGNSTKQVTIGVAKEEDALRIIHSLNGTYIEGQQIHVEEVTKRDSANKNNSGMDYPSNQPQMAPGYQMDAWNAQAQMYPYGYMPVGASPAQDANQAMNTQMMQTYAGYNAMGMYGVANTFGIPPLMQSNSMTNEYQQGQQLNSQGQYGASGLEAPAWPSGYNAQSLNRGYDSDNNQKGYAAQQNPGIDRFGSQDYQGGPQQNNDHGSRNASSRLELDEPRHGNDRGFSQENDRSRDSGSRKRQHSPERGGRHERDKFDSPEFGNHGRGFEGRNSRGKGLGGNRGRDFEGRDSRGKGFGGNQGTDFEGRDSRGKLLGGNQGTDIEGRDSRDKVLGGNQGRDFEGWDSRGKELGGNQGRDFEGRDSRGKVLGGNRGRDFEGWDSRGKVLGGNQGRDFEGRDSRGKVLGGNQGRDFEGWDTRGKELGGNQGRDFEGRDSRGKGLGGNQSRGFESGSQDGGLRSDHRRGYEHDWRNTGFGGLGSNQGGGLDRGSRNTAFGNEDFNRDSRNKRFGNSGGLGDNSRDNGLESNQGRGFECDSRNAGVGNSRGNFEGDSHGGFSNNQSGGFKNDSQAKAFDGKQGKGFGGQDIITRGGKSRESNPPKPQPRAKPVYQQPIKANASGSWSNTSNNPIKTSPTKPFGNKPNFSGTKPFYSQNEPQKPKNQFNLNPGPPLSQSSPVKPVIPEKRPKLDDSICYEEAPTDKKIINKAVTWRQMGISSIFKNIMGRCFHGEFEQWTKACKQSERNMKKEINMQLDEIIKRKYPKNPYPLLQDNEIAALYYKTHPQNQFLKLYNAHFNHLKVLADKPPTKPHRPLTRFEPPNMAPPKSSIVPQAKPPVTLNKPMPAKPSKPLTRYEPPMMGPPKTNIVPHAKTANNKPPLSRMLPPSHRQLSNNPRQRQKPVKKLTPIQIQKQAKREQRIRHKMEFLDQNLYKCKTPAMEKALNAVLDELTDAYTSSVKEDAPTNTDEKAIVQEILKKTTDEFRWTVRLHTIKRILNETKTLMLRFFINGGRAPKTEVERVLSSYGVTGVKAAQKSKTPMWLGSVDSFEKYDALCRHTGVACNGRDGTSYLTAKPLYLTIPMKYRRLLRQKKLSDDGEDEIDFAEDIDDEDQSDDDDDNDDVIEIVKETDVIELSGDENTLNVPDDINNDVKCEDGVATNGTEVTKTVDLTHDDEAAEKSVDDKISEVISDEMGDGIVEIDDEEIKEDDLEDYEVNAEDMSDGIVDEEIKEDDLEDY